VAYPRNLLHEGEEIALDTHPHWRVFLAPLALLVLLLAGLGVVLAVIDLDEDVRPIVLIAVAVLAGLALIWFVLRLIVWRTTHFVVTTDRFIVRSGVLSKSGKEIPLERLDSITFHQSLGERILGVGDLQIESAGESGREVYSDIGRPSQVVNLIHQQIERAQERDGTRNARAGMSVADELAKLDDLRARGVISPEEFETQKARLLAR
jgi:uncharacterized membrane protein YdbT with pleckstrin-like domain